MLKFHCFEFDYEGDYVVREYDVEVKAEGVMFYYDGCHKVYLVTSEEGRRQMVKSGWSLEDLRHPSELPAVWDETCALRFINDADLERDYVPQCVDAVVTWTDSNGTISSRVPDYVKS